MLLRFCKRNFRGLLYTPRLMASTLPVNLSPQSEPHCVQYADELVKRYLSRRPMQRNVGELDTFLLGEDTSVRDAESWADLDRKIAVRADSSTIFVVDSSADDFGSRANYGRGHVMAEIQAGCLTSYEVFARRLMNVAINRLNEDMARSLCLVGSVDSADLSLRCLNLHASQGLEQREILIDAVKKHHQRLTDVLSRLFSCHKRGQAKGVFLVNGDHNHMLSAIGGVYSGTGLKPVIVYVDLHADSRPVEDGPHSGTWCSEAFRNQWVQQAYAVGLNALANSGPTLDNLDAHGAVYSEYTWDKLKSGETSLEAAAEEIATNIQMKFGPEVPVILSICGDSVLHLPSSAGTGTIGYSADEIYKFVSQVCRRCCVLCLTVAELKTSLQPSAAPLVGEFLTQCLHIYHHNSRR